MMQRTTTNTNTPRRVPPAGVRAALRSLTNYPAGRKELGSVTMAFFCGSVIRSGQIKIIAVTLALAACTPMPIGDAWFHFGGVVTDPTGHPIEGARIAIMVNGKALGDGGNTTTDSRGHYSFFAASCPCDFSFTLSASAAGFKPYSINLDGRQANALIQKNITLEPK